MLGGGTAFVALAVATLTVELAGVTYGDDSCSTGAACQPYGVDHACVSGGRMDLRFGVDVAPENTNAVVGGVLAFGFCPVVDELQAFILNGTGEYLLSGDVLSPTLEESFIYAYGQGRQDDPTALTNETGVLFATRTLWCKDDEIAVANFLFLQLSLDRGQFVYDSNESLPRGTGFRGSCDSDRQCPYVAGSICIGHDAGSYNCASCYTAETVKSARTTVWTSYYGTDAKRQLLRSGESNPANFLQFSSGALNKMASLLE